LISSSTLEPSFDPNHDLLDGVAILKFFWRDIFNVAEKNRRRISPRILRGGRFATLTPRGLPNCKDHQQAETDKETQLAHLQLD
jgi:hypothetical protein